MINTEIPTPLWSQPEIVAHTRCLLNSFQRWTGRPLLAEKDSDLEQARALFEAPFVVVSDGLEADPVLNYGNALALRLWAMDWARFTRTPSRQTAEPVHQDERQRMLDDVARQGFSAGYRGVRIAATGKRFMIKQAIVWTVFDEADRLTGRAATFAVWTDLSDH